MGFGMGSFIRQRNSYSRLSITRGLFEDLLHRFEIFPRFREFVLLFGAKHGENEIGPPHMRFRRLVPFGSSSQGCCSGFGAVLSNAQLNILSNRQQSAPMDYDSLS